ncbi:Uncharacterised protein [Vibrio cholerae]|nr:Uncharacterised protein [Vibrio cholerae]
MKLEARLPCFTLLSLTHNLFVKQAILIDRITMPHRQIQL